MNLKKIKIRHFRNIDQIEFNPNSSLNFFVGENGQGKTSILEAIHFVSELKSFRSTASNELVQINRPEAVICAEISHQMGRSITTDLKVRLQSERKTKSAWINNELIRSSTKYLSEKISNPGKGFHSIAFNPSDHELIRGEPRLRRSYLDQTISAVSLEYLTHYRAYQKTLTQRNVLIKSFRLDRGLDEVYRNQLAEFGAHLFVERQRRILAINKLLESVVPEFGFAAESMRISLVSSWAPHHINGVKFSGQSTPASLELVKRSLKEKLDQTSFRDQEVGTTLSGPHRDDWVFLIQEKKLKDIGSQGETRSGLLSLKIAEILCYFDHTQIAPIFLLDDFSSELDRNKRMRLLQFLEKMEIQSFVTTTDGSISPKQNFVIKNGKFIDHDTDIQVIESNGLII